MNCVTVAGDQDYAVAGRLDKQLKFYNSEALHLLRWSQGQLSIEEKKYLWGLDLVTTLNTDMTLVYGNLSSPELFDGIFNNYDARL
ncbi:hypothetical protein [Candidatus Uabimicrobium sp. HlEnr_7]|uniref:hypothetical protein n=1 Tax=Candidatus Uabimicrobium helgolandensis TaxID=3095367 RepID=UPI003555C63E